MTPTSQENLQSPSPACAPRPQWLGAMQPWAHPSFRRPPHLVDVELALPAGQLPVAGGELPDEVVAAKEGSAETCAHPTSRVPPGSPSRPGFFSRAQASWEAGSLGRSPVSPTGQTPNGQGAKGGPQRTEPISAWIPV